MTNTNLEKGIRWRFGPDWLGQRCGAKTRKGPESVDELYYLLPGSDKRISSRKGWILFLGLYF